MEFAKKLFFGICLFPVIFLSAIQAQYRFDRWTTDDGLPQNSVAAIHQTRDGYLWLATGDGLVRFDGVQFTVFDKGGTPGIISNRFLCLYEDATGALWAATENSGVTRYRQGSFTSFTVEDGLPANNVTGITGDEAGNVWVLAEGRIMRFDGEKFVAENLDGLNAAFGASGFERNEFWMADEQRIYRFAGGRLASRQRPADLRAGKILFYAREQNGRLVLVYQGGDVFTLDGDDRVLSMGNWNQPEWTLPSDFAGVEKSRLTLQIKRSFDRELILPNKTGVTKIPMTAAFYDRENSLWLGTSSGGLYRVRKQFISTISSVDGLIEKNVYPIFEDRRGDIWLGVWNQGLSRVSQSGAISNYAMTDKGKSGLITSIYEDRRGRLWVAEWGSLNIFQNGRFIPAEQQITPPDAQIWAIAEDRAGVLWFGTSRGLIRYQNGAVEKFTSKDGLAGDDVRVILEDENGLWLGTYGGLSRYENGRFTSWKEKDGLPSETVRALYKTADGALWIGTYDGGLGRLKDNSIKRITTRDGLFSNGVFQILEDNRGYFWMSSNRGIYRVPHSELDEFADGRRVTVTSTAYGRSDGMLNAECNGGMSPAGIKTRDGRLWFPTQDGAAIINPQAVTVNPLPPPVLIETIKIDNQAVEPATMTQTVNSSGSAIGIEPGAGNFEIQYTALSFVNAENIRFKYKLEGWDKDWAEPGTRRTAYYSRVAPGDYTFRVIAANSDGVWNESGRSLKIRIYPRFYQTWWFYAITALAIFLVIVLIFRYRIRRLQKINDARTAFARQLIASQEQERRRIAVELHDSIGQSLSVIRNRALMSLSTPEKHLKMVVQMEEISKAVAESIEEVRHISHNLHPHQLEYLGLTTALETMLEISDHSSPLKFTAEIEDVAGLLPKEAEINIYRIVQEAVNNILKHSDAQHAVVRLKKQNGFLQLEIKDDGRGFDSEKSASNGAGLGLAGIAERAKMLDAEYEIRSVTGVGTSVKLQIKFLKNNE